MKLYDLIKDVNIITTNIKNFDIEISNICSDSQKAEVDSIFVCLKGIHNDGHDFIQSALLKGAKVIIVEYLTSFIKFNNNITYIEVKNTHMTVANLWNMWYNSPSENLNVVAITGTNGKTSASYMLRQIFNEAGYKTGVIGTVNCLVDDEVIKFDDSKINSMTTPDPEYLFKILRIMADKNIDYVFMEASSHALELNKLEGIKIKVGIFTNLTADHMDFHGTMQNYLSAKAKLFKKCDIGILNADDENFEFISWEATCEQYFYSIKNKMVDFYADTVYNNGINGIEYDFVSNKTKFHITSPIPGEFTVYNTLAAVSCACLLKIDKSYIINAIKKLHGIAGRIERVNLDKTKADFSVFIDYAHTPDALENVLRAIRAFKTKEQRLTVLFGCGGDRDKTKRPKMGAIASRLADFVIITSDNSRSESPNLIIKDILKGVDKESSYTVIENRRNAIEYAVKNARKNDIILLAGKGHEDYEILADGKHPFSEKQIIEQILN